MSRDHQLRIVFAILFLSSTGFGLTLPALPFFVERLALGPAATPDQVALHIGALTSAYALSQVLLGPLFGMGSDRWGRKPFLVLGLLGFAASQALFGLATSLPVLYAMRVLAGASSSALLTAGSAAIIDLVPEGEQLRAMARRGMAVGLGVVVGPAFSGLLSRGDMHGHRMLGSMMLDGFTVPFLAAGAVAMAGVPLVAFGFRSRLHRPVITAVAEGSHARIADILVLTMVAQAALSAFEATFPLYGQASLSLDLNRIGWGFVVCGGVMAMSQGPLIGLLEGRLSPSRQVALAFSFLAAGLSWLAFSRSLLGALGSIGVLAAGMAILTPNLAAAVAARRPSEPGASLGLQNTALGVGQVVGPLIGTALFTLAPPLPFLATAGVAASVSALLWAARAGGRSGPARLR